MNKAQQVYDAVDECRKLKALYNIPTNKKLDYFLDTEFEWVVDEIETLAHLLNAKTLTIRHNTEIFRIQRCVPSISPVHRV